MISVAVLGLGRLGINHVEYVLNIRNFNLKAVCDHNLEVAENVASKYGVSKFTNNPEEIFSDDSIQAVVIVTPTPTHFELVTAALRAGKAVFVEKPLTIDLNESIEIEKVVRETNGYCQVGFMRRFDPDYMEAKKAIESGSIGEPIYFKSISRDPFAPPISFIKGSGGIFVDMSIHDLDIAHFLMGQSISEIASFGGIIKYPEFKETEDVDQALSYLKFANGPRGDIETSRCAFYGYDVRTEVVGTEGTLLIANNKRTNVQVLTNSGSKFELNPIFQDRFTSAYINELNAFANAIEQGLPSMATVEDSIKALKVAYAATTSFKQDGKITSTGI